MFYTLGTVAEENAEGNVLTSRVTSDALHRDVREVGGLHRASHSCGAQGRKVLQSGGLSLRQSTLSPYTLLSAFPLLHPTFHRMGEVYPAKLVEFV